MNATLPEIKIVDQNAKHYEVHDRTRPAQAQRRVRPKVYIFNPSDFPDDIEAGGRFYHFSPQEVTGIEDARRWPIEIDSQGTEKLIKGGRTIIPEGGDAASVAEQVIAERSGRCFVILDGPQTGWPEQMLEARDRWIDARRGEVEQVILSWEHSVSARAASGLGIPVPNRWVKRAYEDRAKYSNQGAAALVVCPVCGERDKSKEAINKHIRLIHPDKVEGLFRDGKTIDDLGTDRVALSSTMQLEVPKDPEQGKALEKFIQDLNPTAEEIQREQTPSAEEPEPAADMIEAKGAPLSEMTNKEAAEDLIGRARVLQIKLTPADLKQLHAGRPEAFASVSERIEQAAKANLKKR